MEGLEKLVRIAEKKSRTSPRAYKFELFLFGLLGYAVIVFSMFALLAILVGLGWLGVSQGGYAIILLLKSKIIFLLLPVIWILLRALWIKVPAPEGFELTRQDYPALFEMLDALSKKLKTPKIHQVLLTNEFNAAIVQTPRLGMFGWTRNTLILGLELLLTMSPEEAKSVVAHELGHLSGNHARFGGWIYRIRLTWAQIIHTLHNENSVASTIMTRFFDWYQPRFDAYSFALARSNEYEADAISAQLTSPQNAAAALVKVNTYSALLSQEFWAPLYKRADKESKPIQRPWAGLHKLISDPNYREVFGGTDKLQASLNNSLEIETSYADTHPSLSDRLAFLKVSATLPDQVITSAAKQWFGDQFNQTLKKFDQDWFDLIKVDWEKRFKTVQEDKKRLVELTDQDDSSLSTDELWEKANLLNEYVNPIAANPIYHQILERKADHSGASFLLGCNALEENNADGLRLLRIASKDENYLMSSCEIAYQWANDNEREDEASYWDTLAAEFIQRANEDHAERAELTKKDTLIVANLTVKQRNHIIEILRASKKVKKAWIAQKKTKHYQATPAIAIAYIPKGFSINYEKISQTIANEIEIDATLYIIPKVSDYKPLAKHIIKNGELLF